MPARPLSRLPGLGPRAADMLAAIGIHNEDELAARGSVAAFAALKQAHSAISLNMLWALEGALSGRDWREVARTDRLRLLLALEAQGISG